LAGRSDFKAPQSPHLLKMGCTQTKAAAPQAYAETSTATEQPSTELPTLLSRTRNGVKQVGKGATGAVTAVGSGAVGAVSAVGNGAKGAVTAVGNGVQQVGSGAVGAACKAGSGAAGAVKRAGKGLVSLTGTGSASQEGLAVEEPSWYERLCALDLINLCCCQAAMDGNLLGTLVKRVLENFDSSMLGVDVQVGDLVLDPSTGRVEVQGLTVANPEGYHSEHLLHADRVVLDIDMQKLLYSFGKEIDVEEMIFDGVDVIYEKGLRSSNLNDLLKKLSETASDKEEQEQEKKKAEGDVKLVLHTVLAQNIGAKLATTLTRGHGLRLEVGDLSYQDFDTEMGAGRGMMDIVRVLIMTLLKSVLATVLGKENTKMITGAANGAKDGMKSAASGSTERLKIGCSKIFSRKGSSTDELLSADPSASLASTAEPSQ